MSTHDPIVDDAEAASALARYHRQMLLPGIGGAGQQRLREAHALVVGCGALGSCIVDSLARAGIGALTIVDRDIVEITNLQRQVLYDEADVAQAMPKAEAARIKVRRINSQVRVAAHVDDFNHRNALTYARDCDLILDGLDNFETRYLLNDLAVHEGIPYIYGGAVGVTGVSFVVLPHNAAQKTKRSTRRITWTPEASTPCLRCVFPEAPPPGSSPSCDTAGVLGPVVGIIALHQAAQAIKLMTGNLAAVDRSLLSIDMWTNDLRRFDVSGARDSINCPCCARGIFDYLEGGASSATVSLCGRNAVQVSPASNSASPGTDLVDLSAIASRLRPHGSFSCNRFMLRGEFATERGGNKEAIELTLFPNGRAIIKGTTEPEVARAIYAKYIGS